ncbi:MAG TPA: LysR family transcriptional regulator [Clostridiaceae bacterium]|nr:LysR family transcriptional regulator [Clostridiaceae bacterium]
MTIKQLKYFISVCESGSFTQAAQQGYISPQGINASILQLEQELGRQLLIRHNKGVKATSDGEFLYKKACQIMLVLQECYDHFHAQQVNTVSPQFPLITDILLYLPMAACDLVLNKYNMEIRPEGGYACESDILNGKCTFALVDGPPFNPKLTYVHCFKVERLLVVNKSHRLAGQKNLTFSDLRNFKFIMPNATFKTYGDFFNLCLDHNFTPNVAIQANSLSETYSLLTRFTDLIGISYDDYLKGNPDQNIVALSINDLVWVCDIFLAYKKDVDFNDQEVNFLSDFMSIFSHHTIA